MTDFEKLKTAIYNGERDTAIAITDKALQEDADPEAILNDGLIAGMNLVGIDFKNNEIYVPEVLIAARAMKSALEILEPKLIEAGVEPIGTIIIGTVQGDLHDIGKNLVSMMLKGAGFNVVDLGTDISPDQFLTAALEHKAAILGLSALLTTTMPMMEKTINTLKEKGLEAQVMIGGAPVTQEYADKVGASGYAADAATAVDIAKQLVGVTA
ncbi:MAG: cobalamin-binding protein [Planctomycetes bacterium]|nr:cobalamin-binding protein [Planctomycetota bacterium]